MENQVHYRDVINFFVKKFRYSTYLELGIRDPRNNFNVIECEFKEGVDIDPNSNATYIMSTNEFFSSIGKNKTWDIIFIDADHKKEQVLEDFKNSLQRLNKGGTIIMDDVNPTVPELLSPKYCNNAWEAFAEISKRKDLTVHAIEGTYSGFVRRGKQEGHSLEIVPTYKFLNKNRKKLFKPFTFEELKEAFNDENRTI